RPSQMLRSLATISKWPGGWRYMNRYRILIDKDYNQTNNLSEADLYEVIGRSARVSALFGGMQPAGGIRADDLHELSLSARLQGLVAEKILLTRRLLA